MDSEAIEEEDWEEHGDVYGGYPKGGKGREGVARARNSWTQVEGSIFRQGHVRGKTTKM